MASLIRGLNTAAGGGAIGLDRAFIAMLGVLVIAALILLSAARKRYPRDVATARHRAGDKGFAASTRLE